MSQPITPHTRRSRNEWLALMAILLLVGAVFIGALLRARNSIEAREGERLQGLVKVVDDNLVRQLEGANNALAGIRTQIENTSRGAADAAVSSQLKLLSAAMPGVRTLVILDSKGTVAASSRDELLGASSIQRDFFNAPRQKPDRATLYVSTPFRSPLGPLVIALGRVVMDAQGKFAGVVVATLDPAYFEVLLRSVLYAPDVRASLAHADGTVFLYAPENEQALGTILANAGSPFSRHLQGGQVASLLRESSSSTGEERLIALRTMDRGDLQMDKPLVAALSRDESAILLPWFKQAQRFGLFYVVILLGTGFGLHFSQGRRRALSRLQATAAEERDQGAKRFEFALRGADLGLWDLHVPSHRFVANAREREMLGYSADEDLSETAWRKLVHRDDRPLVDAAIQRHLTGETAAYECEHRMQHKDGRWVWVYSRGMIVERDENGAPLRIVGTHLDITDRRRADTELSRATDLLQLSEEQLRQVTDNLPVLISRWDTDQRFRFANRAYRDWLGIEPASLLGLSVREVYGEKAYNGFRQHIDAAVGGARVVYEREMATPHGKRHVEVSLIPQFGSDGAVQGVFGLINDLTQRHEAERQRARSEERLSLALEGSGLALFDWDLVGDRIYHSSQAAVMRGEAPVESTASPEAWRTFVHPEDLEAMIERLRDALNGAEPVYHAEFRIRKQSGSWLWLRARGRVVERDDAGRALRLAGTYADINERKLTELRLRHLAEFDTLTDLPNRAQFHDRLKLAMARASPEKAMALLFVDIDHFKSVNDTLGHEAGDQLLKVFATRMSGLVRLSDTVARLGGDEFTVILEGLRDVRDAQLLAGKLVEAMRQPIGLAGKLLEVTTSVGVAIFSAGQTDAAALLGRADAALYEAKRRGRDGYYCDETQDPPGAEANESPDVLIG